MKQALLASAATAPYAHLLGRPTLPAAAAPAPAAAVIEATNDKQQDGESDEHFQQRRDRDSARGASAESDDDDGDIVQGDDESDEDFQKRKKKRDDEAAAAVLATTAASSKDNVGGDRSDAEDLRTNGISAARLRERARCRAIFADAAAGKNPALAAVLAFDTDMPRGQAVKVLRAGGLTAVASGNALDRRMAGISLPVAGASDPGGAGNERPGGQSQATKDGTAVIVAGMRRRGEPEASIQAFIAERANLA